MNKDKLSFVKVIFVFVAFAVASSVLQGLVVTFLWKWFVSDIFGVQEISIPVAIGLAILGNALLSQDAKKEERGWEGTLAHVFIAPLVALFLGWIVQMFV